MSTYRSSRTYRNAGTYQGVGAVEVLRRVTSADAYVWNPARLGHVTDSSGRAWSEAGDCQQSSARPWSASPHVSRAVAKVWDQLARIERGVSAIWGDAHEVVKARSARVWGYPEHSAWVAGKPWLAALGTRLRGVSMPWNKQGELRSVQRSMPWLASLAQIRRLDSIRWQQGEELRRWLALRWQQGGRPAWGIRPPTPPIIPPDPVSPFADGAFVGFNHRCPLDIVQGFVPFNHGVPCYGARETQRSYIVINEATCVRLPDRTPIAVAGFSVAGGASMSTWTVDLDLADKSHLALLLPNADGPREIELTINGYVWTFIVENHGINRRFEDTGVGVTGQSRTALLAAPYAPQRAKDALADRLPAQLIDEELLDTGFTATWESVSWTVPGGTWSYACETPLSAAVKIAEAVGAVVQSHPADKSIRVRPRYPVSPWDWTTTTPDKIIYDDLIVADALSNRSQPKYDAVVVSGEIDGKGVVTRVKRTGEAGNTYAQQVSHVLINTEVAGRERGRNIISDRGQQAAASLTIPLFAEPLPPGTTGLVLPLDLCEVRDAAGTWHGLCTEVRISGQMTEGGEGVVMVIDQDISIERHYTDAD